PDVLAAEYRFIQSFELTNAAISSFYPSLTITASGGFQSLDIDELLNANSLFANIIGGLTQPIFNQRRIKTQYEVSKAQQEQALLNFKKSLDRKSTRLNSSHVKISYAVFCLKKKTKK